jgi:WD40 repeat protein
VQERPGRRVRRQVVLCLAFSPDGSILASGGDCDGIRLWDVASDLERAEIRSDHDYVHSAVFSPDGQTLIVARDGGIIQFWDVAAGQERASIRIASDDYRVAFSTDGRFLAKGSRDGMVRVWDLAQVVASGITRRYETRTSAAVMIDTLSGFG